MTSRYITNLVLFITGIATPYLGTIFFIRTASIFILLPTYLIALMVVFITTLGLRSSDPIKSRKKYYSLGATGAVILFFICYGNLIDIADYVYLHSRKEELNRLVTGIKRYKKIHEMSDGLRFWKTINNTTVEFYPINADTTEDEFGKKYYLDDILKREGITKQDYEAFRQNLIATGFISFTILDDGTISFTKDGMLDNCHGIAYSETGNRPAKNDCGDIIHWKKISDKWYSWGTT